MSSDPNSGGGPHDPLPAIPDAAVSPRSLRSRLVLPLATVVAVAVVAAGAGLFFSGRGGNQPGSPPVLHLANRAVTLAAPVEGLRNGPAVGVAGSRPTLSGTLPDGPDHADVRTFGTGPAPRDRVAALARALGLSGRPERHDNAWQVRSDDPSNHQVLIVADAPGWPWRWVAPLTVVPLPAPVDPPVRVPSKEPPATAAPPTDVHVPDPLPVPIRTVPTMSCLVIIDGHRACPPATPLERHAGEPTPGPSIPEKPDGTAGTGAANGPGPADGGASSGSGQAGAANGTTSSAPARRRTPLPATPDPDAIRAAARPILAGLGLTHPDLTVSTSPGRGQVTANPVVGGLPTSGMSTVLVFDTTAHPAHPVYGNGWLAESRPGTRYPLATARSVLDARPTAKCEPCPRSDPPTTVTGARLGLALNRTDRGGPLLVPAWFYDLRGSDRPLVLVAVDPKFLGAPRGLPGKHPGVSTGQAGQPGVYQPLPPVGGGVRPPVSPAPRPTG